MFGIVKKIFGTAQERMLKKYHKIVRQVVALEVEYQSLTDDELRAKTAEFKERISGGESVDMLLPEAYAVVKNVCRRLCGQEFHVFGYDQKWDMIPYDVQVLGAIAMHYGSISEMQTGEGKTLTATMPLYLNALTGMPVHLVTVNDYLAKRDAEWIGTIFRWLGLEVRSLTNDIPPHQRAEVYQSDIVYGTASEFGFDYLRDNSMAMRREDQVQRGHYFVIIDEVDSILIDEARTPLIISGPATGSRQMYDDLKEDVSRVVSLQKALCTRIADEAANVLKRLGRIEVNEDGTPLPKLPKKEAEEEKEALHRLWLVSKGMPQNKTLRTILENPDLRAGVDKWDIFYFADPNKDERMKTLSELYIIVDERASKYELTERGIAEWASLSDSNSFDDFTMIDLGGEYAKIDRDDSLDNQAKIQKKVALREEDANRKERHHNLKQLFRAHLLMEKDVDYIVDDGKIVIIDENTGRPQPGRRFSDGLHQSIEAKEGVEIQGETQTYATITLQNYFRMYDKLAGMTGTAMTDAAEFKEIYTLDVLSIPTHKKCLRTDHDDEIYMTEREKFNAILKEIEEENEKGRPILLGTESVEVSEKLSRLLDSAKLKHTVLNAKNHMREAEIIAEAGRPGAITVATNMAGRGTDIKLQDGAERFGGLHVIGTTRHQSRRIDRQLKGRSARLGDKGSSKFFVSFEDQLMRLFTSPKITAILQRFRPPEGEAIKAKVLNRSIETAQKRVEQRNYTIRKHTLEYDDVMNLHRKEIYDFRGDVLHEADAVSIAKDVVDSIVIHMCDEFLVDRSLDGGWDLKGFMQWLMTHFPVTFDESLFSDHLIEKEDIRGIALDAVRKVLEQKFAHETEVIEKVSEALGRDLENSSGVIHEVLRSVMVRSIDKLWQEHLLSIDHLRSEVSVRAIGQKDPLVEFKHEAYALFHDLIARIKLDIAHGLFKFEMRMPEPQIESDESVEKVTRAPRKLVNHRPEKFSLDSLFGDDEESPER